MLSRLFGEPAERRTAARLYEAAVERARSPAFYTGCAVPDTLDGRFDMIALHVFLLLRRLKAGGPGQSSLAQALYDAMFEDMDRALRELGAGDLGVGRRVKAMAQAFSGRVAAYDSALDGTDAALRAALSRNVYRCESGPEAAVAALSDYLRRQAAALAAQPIGAVMQGEIAFDRVGIGTDGTSSHE